MQIDRPLSWAGEEEHGRNCFMGKGFHFGMMERDNDKRFQIEHVLNSTELITLK